MNNHVAWHIIGGDDVADHLRHATPYVTASESTTVVTDAATIPAGAIVTGRAAIVENAERFVPHLLGFRVVEEVARAVHQGEAGKLYGCFGSYRGHRGIDPEHVAVDGLLPLLSATLEIIQGNVTRVWARTASLLADNDAWFVTVCVGDVIVTLEAMATANPTSSTELLIEVTGSDRVFRAEPTRQAITIAPNNGPVDTIGWWEDAGERFLQRVLRLESDPMTGSANRLRQTWYAVQESARSGSAVVMD